MNGERFLPIINKQECCKIWFKDIIYMEAEARLVHIVTRLGSFYDYAKLRDMEAYFADEPRFCSVMKGLIVNLDQVDRMYDQMICFSNGTEYPVGRTNFLKIKQVYINYLRQFQLQKE